MLHDYIETIVVVDTDGPTAYIGLLQAIDDHAIRLADVAIYDRRHAKTEYERYLIEAAEIGTTPSRRAIIIRRERIIAVSRLADVV